MGEQEYCEFCGGVIGKTCLNPWGCYNRHEADLERQFEEYHYGVKAAEGAALVSGQRVLSGRPGDADEESPSSGNTTTDALLSPSATSTPEEKE